MAVLYSGSLLQQELTLEMRDCCRLPDIKGKGTSVICILQRTADRSWSRVSVTTERWQCYCHRLALLNANPTATILVVEHLPPFGHYTKLYCLVTETRVKKLLSHYCDLSIANSTANYYTRGTSSSSSTDVLEWPK